MRVDRNAVAVWKRILLVTFCIVTAVLGLTGCGKDKVQETTADTYSMENRNDEDKKSVESSGRMADAAEQSYYNSLDELT